jgi:hypothetical protein
LGLEKGFGLRSVYLINGSKLAYFLEESSMSMNFLAPETSHIMALKIKDYIISSLLLAHHYLRLIIIVTVGVPVHQKDLQHPLEKSVHQNPRELKTQK